MELAKFSYRSERKIIFFKTPPVSWRRVGTYCLNMVNFIIPKKSDHFDALFSQKPLVYELHWTFFYREKLFNVHNLLDSFVWFLQ